MQEPGVVLWSSIDLWGILLTDFQPVCQEKARRLQLDFRIWVSLKQTCLIISSNRELVKHLDAGDPPQPHLKRISRGKTWQLY